MGKYNKRFGNKRCQIRITQRRNALIVESHGHEVPGDYPETEEEFPDAPNEDALLADICRYLTNLHGPEQEDRPQSN